MKAPRPHTREYPAEDRERLGLAVQRAREAAGHQFRPSFAEYAGVGMTSLVKLERGKPVGPVVYEAVARALPGWDEDTPRTILDNPKATVTTGGSVSSPTTTRKAADSRPVHEWSATERAQMQAMPMTEVQETYEMFLRRSEYLAQVWMREVMRVKAEAEQTKAVTDS